MIPKEIIDEIFQTARIEEVIGEFVNLKRAGSNLKGLSPFIKEKTPSFMVSPSKQIFKDFSSGKGGNVVSFLMEHEAMTYPEALRWLAGKYSIEIPEREYTPEEIAQRDERETLFLINQFAQEYFEKCLWESKSGQAIGLSYLEQRGFSEDTIKKFYLGYCLDEGNDFFKTAIKAGYNEEALLKLGLAKKGSKGIYDFYKGRVMFPIRNLTGRVVGFGGRTLRKDKKTAKYFNSPDSEVYNKSKVLYGLYQSKSEIVKLDNCFLVEGYTDVISLHQNGIKNVVASSGTALTEDQIRLIDRYTKNITILFDGDAAGIKASFRGIDMILEQGLNVRIVLFPEGEDPDSFAQANPIADIQKYFKEHTRDFVSFKTDVLLAEANNDPIKKADLIRQILQSIALIPDQITRSVYLRESSERFQMDEQDLAYELAKIRRTKFNQTQKEENRLPALQTSKKTGVVQAKSSDGYHQEADIIRILLNHGNKKITVEYDDEEGETQSSEQYVAEYIIDQIEMDHLKFGTPLLADIYEVFVNENHSDKVPGAEFFYTHHNPEISKMAVDLCTSMYHLSHNWWKKHLIDTKLEEQHLLESTNGAIYAFKMHKINELIQINAENLKTVTDEEEMFGLLEAQKNLINVRKMLSDLMNRTIIK